MTSYLTDIFAQPNLVERSNLIRSGDELRIIDFKEL